jgi:predicted nucleotidyltransferase
MVFSAAMSRQSSGGDPSDTARRATELLSRDPRVKLVYLFGSAADRQHPTPRDIDLAIWTDPPFSLDELTRRRADVVLATAGHIDLLSLNEAPIVLAHEVVESGRCLYVQDAEIETDFVTRTRSRYWDFKPYREEQWRLTRLRLEERLIGR